VYTEDLHSHALTPKPLLMGDHWCVHSQGRFLENNNPNFRSSGSQLSELKK